MYLYSQKIYSMRLQIVTKTSCLFAAHREAAAGTKKKRKKKQVPVSFPWCSQRLSHCYCPLSHVFILKGQVNVINEECLFGQMGSNLRLPCEAPIASIVIYYKPNDKKTTKENKKTQKKKQQTNHNPTLWNVKHPVHQCNQTYFTWIFVTSLLFVCVRRENLDKNVNKIYWYRSRWL